MEQSQGLGCTHFIFRGMILKKVDPMKPCAYQLSLRLELLLAEKCRFGVPRVN